MFGALYGGGTWGPSVSRAGLAYARHDIATRRTVQVASITDVLSASVDGSTAQAFGEIGYRLEARDAFVEPILGASVLRLRTDGFVEGGGPLALAGASRVHDLATSTLGLRGEIRLARDGPFTVRGLVGWRRAYGDVDPDALLAFAGGCLSVHDIRRPRRPRCPGGGSGVRLAGPGGSHPGSGLCRPVGPQCPGSRPEGEPDMALFDTLRRYSAEPGSGSNDTGAETMFAHVLRRPAAFIGWPGAAAALALVLAGPTQAFAQQPGYDRFREGVFLRYLDADAGVMRRVPQLGLSFGGRTYRAVLDTGSTGVVVAADMIPGFDALPSAGEGRLTYTSSGRVMIGQWVTTPLTLVGQDGAQVVTSPLPVLAVTRVECLREARDCSENDDPRIIAMIGVGFAREHDRQSQSTPDKNPLLHVAPNGREQRRGYVLGIEGIHVGLTAANTQGDFQFVRLTRQA